MPRELLDLERLLHLLTDVRIMQCQIDAVEEILKSRIGNSEAVDSEERRQADVLLRRVVTRLRSKSNVLYAAFR